MRWRRLRCWLFGHAVAENIEYPSGFGYRVYAVCTRCRVTLGTRAASAGGSGEGS